MTMPYKCRIIQAPNKTFINIKKGKYIIQGDLDTFKAEDVEEWGTTPFFEVSYNTKMPSYQPHLCTSMGDFMENLCNALEAGHTTVIQDDAKARRVGFADVTAGVYYTVPLVFLKAGPRCYFGCDGQGCNCNQSAYALTPSENATYRSMVMDRMTALGLPDIMDRTANKVFCTPATRRTLFNHNTSVMVPTDVRAEASNARDTMRGMLNARLDCLTGVYDAIPPDFNQVTIYVRMSTVCLEYEEFGVMGYSVFADIAMTLTQEKVPEGTEHFDFESDLESIPEVDPTMEPCKWIEAQVEKAIGLRKVTKDNVTEIVAAEENC
jgi:hypothetical protein